MRFRIIFLLSAIFFTCAFSASAFAEGKVLRLGKVSNKPRKHYPKVKVMAEYLADHLANRGYKGSEVVFARDINHMVILMKTGKVDLVSETAYSARILEERGAGTTLLREWRDLNSNYRSVLFSRKDSSIQSIKDLEGKVIAFEDPDSTSAYYLPSIEIAKAGLKLVDIHYPGTQVSLSPGEVGYVFARQEINISIWVEEGKVDAGAMSDLDMEDTDNIPEAILPDLRVFHRSEPYPRALLLAGNSFPKAEQEAVKEVLLKAHLSSEGREVLDIYKDVSQYDLLPKEERQTLDGIKLP